jgi:hypothetical protein
VNFKLDENLSPTLAAGFLAAGHDAHSVLEQALGGAEELLGRLWIVESGRIRIHD